MKLTSVSDGLQQSGAPKAAAKALLRVFTCGQWL